MLYFVPTLDNGHHIFILKNVIEKQLMSDGVQYPWFLQRLLYSKNNAANKLCEQNFINTRHLVNTYHKQIC